MTKAVCLHCGDICWGALTPCEACGYAPDSAYEIGYAILESDHHRTPEGLQQLSAMFKQRYEENKGVFVRHGEDAERIILSMFDSCDARDIFSLRREAKDGFMKKQMNFHFTGPDGYEFQLVQRKRDIPKDQFDAFRKTCDMDVFFVSSYENGRKQHAQVPKNIWYATRDHMVLLDRLHAAQDGVLRALFAQGLNETKRYLKKFGFDLGETI